MYPPPPTHHLPITTATTTATTSTSTAAATMLARRTVISHQAQRYNNSEFENDTRAISRKPIATHRPNVQPGPDYRTPLSQSHLSENLVSRPIPIPVPKKAKGRGKSLKLAKPEPFSEYHYTLLPSSPSPSKTIIVTSTEKAARPVHPSQVTLLASPQVSRIHARAERESTLPKREIDPSFGAIRKGVVVYGNGHWVLRPDPISTTKPEEPTPAQKSLQAVRESQSRLAVAVAKESERHYDEKKRARAGLLASYEKRLGRALKGIRRDSL